jgi:hypothetical protein
VRRSDAGFEAIADPLVLVPVLALLAEVPLLAEVAALVLVGLPVAEVVGVRFVRGLLGCGCEPVELAAAAS